MSSVPPSTSYTKVASTALETAWTKTRGVTSTHVVPVLKQIAAKLMTVWEAVSPSLQRITESKLGPSFILLGLAVIPLTLAGLQGEKKNALATAFLYSVGLILTAGGFSFLFASGILPGALTGSVTILS